MAMQNLPWYQIKNAEEIDTPALIFYPDRIQRNIEMMISMVGDLKRLRPHIKTHKCAEIIRMQQSAGIQQFKCATIAEAELLAQSGAEDILLAYQPVGPKIHRLQRLTNKYRHSRFSALVDNTEIAGAIASSFNNDDRSLDVYIDIDVGMHRTGIKPSQGAIDLFSFCNKVPGINPVGLHVYDGHIRDTVLAERTTRIQDCYKAITELVSVMDKLVDYKLDIVAGGSPSFPVHAKNLRVTCSPGTSLLWDRGYADMLPEQKFEFGAVLMTRIISKPSKNVICLDAGHKSMAAEKVHPRIYFLNLKTPCTHTGQSEEHLVLEVEDDSRLNVGDVLYGIPKHICPTCALHQCAHIVDNHTAKSTWKIAARDRMISI